MIVEVLIFILLLVFDNVIRHYLTTFFKFTTKEEDQTLESLTTLKQPTQQNNFLPEIFEFEATENVSDDEKEKSYLPKRKVIQKAICMTVDDVGSQKNEKKWQFVCKICHKAFRTLNLCEDHILKNEHTSLPVEASFDENFEDLKTQLEILRKMNEEPINKGNEVTFTNGIDSNTGTFSYGTQVNKDFIPIHFGKWSKVICELRHRFDEIRKEDNPNEEVKSLSENMTEIYLKEHCKVPLSENNHQNLTSKLPDLSTSTEIYYQNESNFEKEDTCLESNKTINCHIEKSKICLNFITRLLYCETCLTTFNTIEQVFAHFKMDGDSSDKSTDQYTWDEYDILNQTENKSIPSPIMEILKNSIIEEELSDNDIENTLKKAAFTNSNGKENEENLKENEISSGDFPKNAEITITFNDNQGMDEQLEESSLESYSENIPLVVGHSCADWTMSEKRKKKRKKKKKKAWRLLKRSMMYTITFLF